MRRKDKFVHESRRQASKALLFTGGQFGEIVKEYFLVRLCFCVSDLTASSRTGREEGWGPRVARAAHVTLRWPCTRAVGGIDIWVSAQPLRSKDIGLGMRATCRRTWVALISWPLICTKSPQSFIFPIV